MVYARVRSGEWGVGDGWGNEVTFLLSVLERSPLSLSGAFSIIAYRICSWLFLKMVNSCIDDEREEE